MISPRAAQHYPKHLFSQMGHGEKSNMHQSSWESKPLCLSRELITVHKTPAPGVALSAETPRSLTFLEVPAGQCSVACLSSTFSVDPEVQSPGLPN